MILHVLVASYAMPGTEPAHSAMTVLQSLYNELFTQLFGLCPRFRKENEVNSFLLMDPTLRTRIFHVIALSQGSSRIDIRSSLRVIG